MRTVDTGHIVIDPAVLGGEPHIAVSHIAGRRIAVAHIAVWIVYQGEPPDAIAREFALTLGEVYAALAYYYDHQHEIDTSIADTAQRADEMARRYPHGWSPAHQDATGGVHWSWSRTQ